MTAGTFIKNILLNSLLFSRVEFMSKFYKGVGYPFQPFSFKAILEQEENPES